MEIKNWLLKKTTEIKSWFALAIIIFAALHMAYSIFFWVSLGVLLVDDSYFQKLLAKVSPTLKAKIEAWK